MLVILKNDAQTNQGSREGIYEADQIVNGKRSWKSTANALWFVPMFNCWGIGVLDDIGGQNLGIRSSNGTGDNSPYDVPISDWLYLNGSEYKRPTESDDIIIQYIPSKYHGSS